VIRYTLENRPSKGFRRVKHNN